MEIIVDTREQLPYSFKKFLRWRGKGQKHGEMLDKVTVDTLKTGDYSLQGYQKQVAVERKSLDDFVGSIMQGRDRFVLEMLRAQELDYFAIVIEATTFDVSRRQFHGEANPHSILQTAISWPIKYGIDIVWATNRAGGEYFTFWILQKWLRAKGYE